MASPPQPEEILDLVKLSGMELKKLLNTSGKSYRALGKEVVAAMPVEQLLQAMNADGKLIKRPLLSDGQRLLLGFNEAKSEEFIKTIAK